MKENELYNLINKCKKNDRASQNALFNLFADHVMNIALRYAKDDFEAKDIFLRAFEKAFGKIEQYDTDKGKFVGWLSKITTNEALSLLRSQKRYLFTSDMTLLDNNVESYILNDLDAEHLIALINELDEPYRIIFNMVLDGYKHREIAEELNIKESTSRSYFFRAREILKVQIGESQSSKKSWKKRI